MRLINEAHKLNIRGLGSQAKCNEIKELVRSYGVELCCIQETMQELANELLYRSLWGTRNFGWAFKESEERSGGIL